MIIVCFGDGLGNQMFQYAFYKGMMKKYPNCTFKADIDDFYGSMNEHNGYELDRIFGIELDRCTRTEAMVLMDYYPRYKKKNKLFMKILKYKDYLFGKKDSFITVDDPTIFYPELYSLNPLKSYIFRGNWINEKYFEHIRFELLRDFKFPEIREEDEKNYQLQRLILSTNSVSIHIRGGDYLETGMVHLRNDYYSRAVKYMEENYEEQLTYFVFTNDVHYFRSLDLDLRNYYIVQGNIGSKSYIDMHLMSLCKNNIIANSTFSFWGAYLNKHRNKIVVSPQKAAPEYANPFSCSEWLHI